TTVNASVSFSASLFLLGLLGLVIPIILQSVFNRIEFKSQVVGLFFLLAMILSLVLNSVIMPNRGNFDKEEHFYAVENKSHYFADKTVELIAMSNDDAPDERFKSLYANTTYPLMHKMDYRDILGEHFNTGEELPNIVVIQVEGLGKAFVGKDAPKGGFTPFLDSLETHSLHWDNFLSSAGRTFGILPSLYGSLPFYKNGFMELGDRMPKHVSLISLLRPQGYQTNFYYGGNANFDKQDVFLEAEGIDLIVSEKSFPPTYTKMKANSEGFSWGYGDKDVFKRSLEVLAKLEQKPRLDIYMTLTTHEPFRVPEDRYHAKFDRLAASSRIDRDILSNNRGVFECLLYTDDAISDFIQAYRSRPDFDKTIFIITGDHRMIPVPHENSIDRFHVPFMIWSPMLKKGEQFKGVGSHHNVAATLMAFLAGKYGLKFPAELPFIGGVLDNSKTFSSKVEQPIMRNKNDLSCYVMGNHFLTDGTVFTITDGMNLTRNSNGRITDEINARLEQFRQVNLLVCEKNRLFNGKTAAAVTASYTLTPGDKTFLQASGIGKLGVDDQFFKARDLAFDGKYEQSRIVLKNILNSSPNYSDVRILLGRTYLWQDRYDDARKELKEAARRSPAYQDVYIALVDCENYAGRPDSARFWLDEGMKNADETTTLAQKGKSVKTIPKKSTKP
ncbi:MAG: sulfatase-like hydrolase/transferase, partial [Bacteroidota bacterium]